MAFVDLVGFGHNINNNNLYLLIEHGVTLNLMPWPRRKWGGVPHLFVVHGSYSVNLRQKLKAVGMFPTAIVLAFQSFLKTKGNTFIHTYTQILS